MTTVKLYKTQRPTKAKPKRQVWIIRWHGTERTRYCKTIGVVGKMSMREAKYIRREKQGKLDCKVIRPDRPNRITLEDFIKWHENTIEAARGIRTIRQYRVAGNHAVSAIGGKCVILKIDVPAARRVVNHLVKLKRSPATIKKTISKLRTMFGRAVSANFIAENPFMALEMPKVQPRMKRIFTDEEFDAMLRFCPNQWWRTFLSLAVDSGLRLQELLHLTWWDIDFAKSELAVSAKQAGHFEVKGQGHFPIFKWSAKSHTGRTIPLPEEVIEELSALRKSSDGSLYVFVSCDRLLALESKQKAGKLREDFEIVNNVLRDFKTIQAHAFAILDDKKSVNAEKTPVRPIGTIHDLRKTYGTRMADIVPMHVLQQLMGHADITTTAKYYLGVIEGHADQIRSAWRIKTDSQQTRKPDLRLVGHNYPYPQNHTTPAANGSY